MIKVYVKKTSSAGVSTPKLKNALKKFLEKNGIFSDAVVEVAIVGEKKMLELAKTYLDEDNVLHNVLSFPTSETKGQFVTPPDGFMHLGEIVVCYPQAVREANDEGKRIDEKVIELVEHSALHLLGIHHD